MKTILVFATLMAITFAKDTDTYDPAYDNFNAEELVESVRLLENYAKCFLHRGHCTAEATKFKKMIPEALQTSCSKCTARQRELIRVVCAAFMDKVPDLWAELIETEDPDGKYREDFDKFLAGTD